MRSRVRNSHSWKLAASPPQWIYAPVLVCHGATLRIKEKWITRSQVDLFSSCHCLKQARSLLGCTVRTSRKSWINEMSSNLLPYQCGLSAQWAIGATRCDGKCGNTVLLETQGPCGGVRRCRDDTVTHDTSVQVKMSQLASRTPQRRRITRPHFALRHHEPKSQNINATVGVHRTVHDSSRCTESMVSQ